MVPAATLSRVAAASPASVICFVRYETMPNNRWRSPPVVGFPYWAYAVTRKPPTRLESSVSSTRTDTRPMTSLHRRPAQGRHGTRVGVEHAHGHASHDVLALVAGATVVVLAGHERDTHA